MLYTRSIPFHNIHTIYLHVINTYHHLTCDTYLLFLNVFINGQFYLYSLHITVLHYPGIQLARQCSGVVGYSKMQMVYIVVLLGYIQVSNIETPVMNIHIQCNTDVLWRHCVNTCSAFLHNTSSAFLHNTCSAFLHNTCLLPV